jgi:hypothetical protein
MFWAGRIEMYHLHINVTLPPNLVIIQYLKTKGAFFPSECNQSIARTS